MLMVWMEAEASRRSEEPSFFGVVVRRLGTLRFLLVEWCKTLFAVQCCSCFFWFGLVDRLLLPGC